MKKKVAGKSTRKSAKKKAKKGARTAKSRVKKAVRKTARKKVARKSAKKTVKKKAARKPAKKTTRKKAGKKAVKKTKRKTAKKKAVRKKVVKRKAVKKKAAKKAVKKTTKKKAAKKTAAKKPAAIKAPAAKTVRKRAQKPEPQKAVGHYDGVLLCESPKVLPKKSPYTKKEIETLHTLMLEERGRLREVLRDLEAMSLPANSHTGSGMAPGYSIHLAEDATENIDTETALLLRRDEEEALLQVDSALLRLENELYGVCIACGDKIGMDRLKVVPEAHLCMTCRRLYDRKAGERRGGGRG